MELTVDIISQLIKLVVENKLDKLELGDLKIMKTRYESPKQEQKSLNNNTSINDADELLFWSTSSPSLTQEQIAELAMNGLPDLPKPKRGRKSKES